MMPPNPPSIEVSRTVDVISTGDPQQTQTTQQYQDQQNPTKNVEAISNKTFQSTGRKRSNTRTSAFAESLEQPSCRNRQKLEPRIEPSGSAYGGRRPGETTPEIGIISFLCEYPRASAQRPGPKKNLFQNFLHRSNSERKLLSESKQNMAAAVAMKRTSDGRHYGQIVIKGLYEDGENKSTYQINDVDGVRKSSKKNRPRGRKLGEEMVKNVTKREPIESLRGDGGSAISTSDAMADSIYRNPNDGEKKEKEMQQVRDIERQKRETSPAPMLPLQKATEGNFGIDFSSILKRHEEVAMSPKKVKRGSLNTSLMTRSESRPNVRDFAGEGSSNFIRSAFRRRSKSPNKISSVKEPTAKQSLLKQSPSKRWDQHKVVQVEMPNGPSTTPELPDISTYTRRINSIRDSVAQHGGLGALVPLVEPESSDQGRSIVEDAQRQSTMSQGQQSSGQSFNARNSSTSNGHSQSPSGISARSNENDNLSEVSSAIISDAQSISIHKTIGSAECGNGSLPRKPLRPGPAPTGPLPSLPEGHDVQQPSTPRRSESVQRKPSPERSPTKSRHKTQARYRFSPTEDSPTKRSLSPIRMNTATKSEVSTKKPAALVKIQTANLNAFPAPPLPSPEKTRRQATTSAISEKLPMSLSDGRLGARAERTKKLKAKDLAQERSKTATFVDETQTHIRTMRTTPTMTNEGDGQKDSIERLIDSYDTQHVPNPWHRPQASLVSTFSTSTQDHRNSTGISELSPIIVVADQEPIHSPKPLSVKTPSSEIKNGYCNIPFGTEKHHAPFSSPDHLHEQSDPCRASDCTLQRPQPPDKSPRRSIANVSPRRSIANRAPTPFTHPNLMRIDSHQSPHRSSFVEPDLEARMAAMEKKNLLLERAFLAVMDASASISSRDGSRGRESGHSFGTGDRYSGSAAGELDHLGQENVVNDGNGNRLYVDLEKLLVRRGSGRVSTLSTSSGPF